MRSRFWRHGKTTLSPFLCCAHIGIHVSMVHVCTCVYLHVSVRRQGIHWSRISSGRWTVSATGHISSRSSPSLWFLWVLVIKLRSLRLWGKHVTNTAISSVHSPFSFQTQAVAAGFCHDDLHSSLHNGVSQSCSGNSQVRAKTNHFALEVVISGI